jgi:hypothetical protein
MAKIVLEIPDAEIKKGQWLPDGVSLVRLAQNPLLTMKGEMTFFVRDEWIKEVKPE